MGKLVQIKTRQTDHSVEDHIDGLANEQQRKDSRVLLKLMAKATKEEPRMWGNAMIGFGKKIYKSPATGREVEWFKMGFSPRKANLSLHLTMDIKQQAAKLKMLGRHKTGVGCLYINKLADVDLRVLEELIATAAKGK